MTIFVAIVMFSATDYRLINSLSTTLVPLNDSFLGLQMVKLLCLQFYFLIAIIMLTLVTIYTLPACWRQCFLNTSAVPVTFKFLTTQ